MSLSTVIVALNSQTLRKYEPKETEFMEKAIPVEVKEKLSIKPSELLRKALERLLREIKILNLGEWRQVWDLNPRFII